MTALVLKTFRLNGRFLAAAETITEGSGLTAARWQVLGAVLPGPLSVADVARSMGLTRQSVQRIADVLVDEGLCAYADNPAHKRSKLLAPTAKGDKAIARICPRQVAWANRIGAAVGETVLSDLDRSLEKVLRALSANKRETPRRRGAAE